MITHYGLFWSERDAFWGRPKNQGLLLGREKEPLGRKGAPSKDERAKANDYRDYVGLYCLYGDGELLYIGEAGLQTKRNIFERLKNHRTGALADRWDTFSWFGREAANGRCEVSDAIAQLDAIAIAIVNPGFNKQSGAFACAKQVNQVAHEEAEGDVETKLNRLFDLVVKAQPKPPAKRRGRPPKAKQT